MSDEHPPKEESGELTAPARFTRDTLLGCIGLFCVLLTLPLIWLAVGAGPGWLSHLLPLLAFATAIGGAALTLRAPGAFTARSSDPRRPLTHAGFAPTIERPATYTHRLAWGLTATLLIAAFTGYTVEFLRPGATAGLVSMLCAGCLILAQGVLVGVGRLPAPALRWVRLSIYGATGRQSGLLIALGFIVGGGALFLALLDGYVWGLVGLALLITALALVTPLARRMPTRHDPPRAMRPQVGPPE